MTKDSLELSRSEKILLTLYRLSEKSRKSIRYEDIVVALFRNYPADFHLKGYPEYPDSGDHIHKPLYDFRKRGLVDAGKKMFALTSLGIEMSKRIEEAVSGKKVLPGKGRLAHFIERELIRVGRLESLDFFSRGKKEKILDTDFYDYLDVTVRTNKSDFLGRVETMSNVMEELKETKDPKYNLLIEYHNYLLDKFEDIIGYMKKR